MRLSLPVKPPFSFAQTVAFLRSFPPCQGDHVITDHSLTAAVSVGGIARVFTIHAAAGRGDGDPLVVEMPRHVDAATQRALLGHAAHWIGAGDDLTAFYAAAAGDPPMRALVAELHGLHHVRFLTLEDIAVYCVLMQRTPIGLASLYRRRFLARFGIPVDAGGATLRAMPALDQLVELDAGEIAGAIGHAGKARRIVDVVRGVAAIGETALRTAPYAVARDALLAIPGVGPFSAAAILLRGLGRMDELPELRAVADAARAVYGAAYDPAAIARRYGDQIGTWSFYLRTGAGRMRRAVTASRSADPSRRAASRAA